MSKNEDHLWECKGSNVVEEPRALEQSRDGPNAKTTLQWFMSLLHIYKQSSELNTQDSTLPLSTDSMGTDDTCFSKLQIISLSWETRMLWPQTLQLLSPGLSLQYQPWGMKLSVYIRTYSHGYDTACLYIVLLLSYIVTCLEYFEWTFLCILLQASLVDNFSF